MRPSSAEPTGWLALFGCRSAALRDGLGLAVDLNFNRNSNFFNWLNILLKLDTETQTVLETLRTKDSLKRSTAIEFVKEISNEKPGLILGPHRPESNHLLVPTPQPNLVALPKTEMASLCERWPGI